MPAATTPAAATAQQGHTAVDCLQAERIGIKNSRFQQAQWVKKVRTSLYVMKQTNETRTNNERAVVCVDEEQARINSRRACKRSGSKRSAIL